MVSRACKLFKVINNWWAFKIISRGNDKVSDHIKDEYVAPPGGHQEGYVEAFARIYDKFVDAIYKRKQGEILTPSDIDFPTVEDGVQGMRFVEKCLESSNQGGVWVNF